MKVELMDGYIRWDYKDFHIRRGNIVECTPEVFKLAQGKLIEVKEDKAVKKKKSKKDFESPLEE